jgi:hypothetical protein
MSDTINLSNIDSKLQSFVNDQYISSSIILFIAFYTCMIAPKLPESFVPLMNSQLFNLMVLLLIGYLATKNHVIGIVASIAYFVTLNTVQKYELNNKMSTDMLNNAIEEGQINAQIIVPKCGKSELSPEQIKQIIELRKQISQQAQYVEQEKQEQEQQEKQEKQFQQSTTSDQIVDQILTDNTPNVENKNRNDENINDKLSGRNFFVAHSMTQNQSPIDNIGGNCMHLSNIEGLPLNL